MRVTFWPYKIEDNIGKEPKIQRFSSIELRAISLSKAVESCEY